MFNIFRTLDIGDYIYSMRDARRCGVGDVLREGNTYIFIIARKKKRFKVLTFECVKENVQTVYESWCSPLAFIGFTVWGWTEP